jgi:hypothetical protein
MDRYVGGCAGRIAPRDPGSRFVGGQVGWAAPVHSRFVGGQVGFISGAVTPASKYVGGMAGYVSCVGPWATRER